MAWLRKRSVPCNRADERKPYTAPTPSSTREQAGARARVPPTYILDSTRGPEYVCLSDQIKFSFGCLLAASFRPFALQICTSENVIPTWIRYINHQHQFHLHRQPHLPSPLPPPLSHSPSPFWRLLAQKSIVRFKHVGGNFGYVNDRRQCIKWFLLSLGCECGSRVFALLSAPLRSDGAVGPGYVSGLCAWCVCGSAQANDNKYKKTNEWHPN